MLLKEFLEKKMLTPSQFAKLSDISCNAIYGYLRGNIPTASICYKIMVFTEGKVTLKDLGR